MREQNRYTFNVDEETEYESFRSVASVCVAVDG